ncbi:MAG: SH3 domain-containing protein [Pseudomonadota bacterium]
MLAMAFCALEGSQVKAGEVQIAAQEGSGSLSIEDILMLKTLGFSDKEIRETAAKVGPIAISALDEVKLRAAGLDDAIIEFLRSGEPQEPEPADEVEAPTAELESETPSEGTESPAEVTDKALSLKRLGFSDPEIADAVSLSGLPPAIGMEDAARLKEAGLGAALISFLMEPSADKLEALTAKADKPDSEGKDETAATTDSEMGDSEAGDRSRSSMGVLTDVLLVGDEAGSGWIGSFIEEAYQLSNGGEENASRFFFYRPDRAPGEGVSFSVRVEGERAPGVDNFALGLLYGYQGEGKPYYALVTDGSGRVIFFRRSGKGVEQLISIDRDGLKGQEPLVLEIIETGEGIDLYADGEQFSGFDSEGIGNGGVGIIAIGTGQFLYADFAVEQVRFEPTGPDPLAEEDKIDLPRWQVETTRGEIFVGQPADHQLPFTTAYGTIDVSASDLESWRESTLSLADGSRFKGQFALDSLSLKSATAGTLQIAIEDIDAVTRLDEQKTATPEVPDAAKVPDPKKTAGAGDLVEDHSHVVTTHANLRAEPTLSGKKIGVLPPGSKIKVLPSALGNSWLKVEQSPLGPGYLYATLARPKGGSNALGSTSQEANLSQDYTVINQTDSDILVYFDDSDAFVVLRPGQSHLRRLSPGRHSIKLETFLDMDLFKMPLEKAWRSILIPNAETVWIAKNEDFN